MSDFPNPKNELFQFTCIPRAFLKLVIGIGVLLFAIAPFLAIYILKNAPALKIPAIALALFLGVLLSVLKQKWKDRYEFKITSASLIIQVNKKQPPMSFAYSQIQRFSLSPFVDGLGNQVSKLTLFDHASKRIFSIKILNQNEQVWEFLKAWQQALPLEIKVVRKNGALHAIERLGEILGNFDKSTDIARIDFINTHAMRS